ncbi:MAG TPA: MerR family transcriptional regulator [Candidatus Cybelea sp.]|jgi:DNA-binding transcriptional MerR regulator|nr:MerR family transcriptional regulator [Candidatus Cybelea sp.]
MKRLNGALRQVKAFADEVGVSVRTLHLYDRLGLLKPAGVTESGYRLYGEGELERLEHILALRFVGLRLEQIKELLGDSPRPLRIALRLQRDVIVRQRQRLDKALAVIEGAQATLAIDTAADRGEVLRKLMEVFKMQNDFQWTQEYYSEEAREAIEERRRAMPSEAIERGQREWAALIADVESAVTQGVDPSDERAAALAARWRALVGSFTQDNAEVASGLNKLWSDQAHWPADFKRPWSDAADAFINEAMGCK